MKKNTKEKPIITLTEINIGDSVESFSKFLETQKNLFHSQVDHLQNIVTTQCRLTGVNPLSQEMAAGALSINIGKRPRDLLNPKGVKYMQSVFSIKDTISKKETREISALCGVTITQVREFFASQRARVRKHVRLSKEKATKVEAARLTHEGCSMSSDYAIHDINPILSSPVDPIPIKSDAQNVLQGECSTNSEDMMDIINPTPLNTVDPKVAGDAPCSTLKEETVPGADDYEKKFIENIFNLMRKEESFSGQVKLMEWILKIQNSSVLYWFVTKGGLMMIAAWLNEAALEEQTTALQVIFQVLSHLPLNKAQPLQLSAMVPTVSRLRFYRTSDISNRAKLLLSRWSKLFIRIQALKKPSTSGARNGRNTSQSGVLNSDWNSQFDIPEDILSLALDGSEDCRKLDTPPNLKLLESSDDLNKRNSRNVSSTQTKERRKVQLMEQPSRNSNGRTRTTISNQGRPMSADDIQKAKLRATFMQSKYGKIAAPNSSVSRRHNTEEKLTKPSTSQIRPLSSPLKPHVRPAIVKTEKPESYLTLPKPTIKPVVPTPPNSCLTPPELSFTQLELTTKPVVPNSPEPTMKPVAPTPPELQETKPGVYFSEVYPTPPEPTMESPTPLEVFVTPPELLETKPIVVQLDASSIQPKPLMTPVVLTPETCPIQPETPMDAYPCMEPEESPWEKLMRNKISWHLPPELKSEWRVGVGENSKEVEVQTKRIGREKEIIYWRSQDIPPNPKEPWDFELDYDDTLTPQIPFEQAPEEYSPLEEQIPTLPSVTPEANTTAVSGSSSDNIAAEPDLELLAVLLKNPHIVFALTSHQAGNLTSEDTVKLLDMIKSTGGDLSQALNGFSEQQQNGGSFPSPTPHSFPSPTPTPIPIPTSFPSPTPHSEYSTNGRKSEPSHNSYQQPGESHASYGMAPHDQYQGQTITPQQNQEYWVENVERNPSQFYHREQGRETTPQQMNQNSTQMPQAYNSSQHNYAGTSHYQQQEEPMSYGHVPMQQPETVSYVQTQTVQPAPISNYVGMSHYQQQEEPRSYGHVPMQQPETVSYGQTQTVQPAPISAVMNLPNGSTPIPLPAHYPEQWNQMGDVRDERYTRYDAPGSHPWPHQPNHNNYNNASFYDEPPILPFECSTWDCDEFEDNGTYSPRRMVERSRSPGHRGYSEHNRRGGRNPRHDWPRRRESGRRGRNRKWRGRRR
ncbi:hypothetical protein ACHQM5_015083 [Ranunculus cassubicifolius]